MTDKESEGRMTLKEAAQQALEALNEVTGWQWAGPMRVMDEVEDAITALRQALEQPDDEIDWKDQYEKQKRRAEMWVAKYEKDIGPVEMAVPMQQSEALKLADALEQDTRGYEPVTDAARELRRLYAENQRLKAQPADEPVAWQLSPTDIYDFAGWLTTRKGVMTVGSSCEAGPMAEAVGEYLKTFPERFNTRTQPAVWVGLTDEERGAWLIERMKPQSAWAIDDILRDYETTLREKNT